MKKWLWVLVIVIIVAAIWFFIKPGNATLQTAAFEPQIEKITKGNIRVEVSATGIIEPINKVEIKSKASGLIEEMTIEEADMVKKGALIALLDQRDTKNAYDQSIADLEAADANVKYSESDFERKKELFNRGLISASDYDQAKLALVDAKAQQVRAKINVDNNDIRFKDTIVKSPIDGVILTKDVEVGQIISSGISSVSGGTLIATVAEMSEVYVKADVDEVDIGKIRNGMKASVVADAFPNQVFYGDVVRIAAQAKVTQNVTSFEVTIIVKNLNSTLKAGMNTSVDILIADKKDVVLIPNEAMMTQKEMQMEIVKLHMAMNPAEENAGNNMGGNKGEWAEKKPQASDTTDSKDSFRRGVIIKDGDNLRIQLVQAGVSNFDYTEAVDGVKEGDQVVYSYFSRAKQSSSEFRQRMQQMNNMRSGMRN